MRRQSITPEDAGCQLLLAERLGRLGFQIQHLPFADVDNLWAMHGDIGPLFCFAGHTDVVPAGNHQDWNHPPFEPRIDKGILSGRGVADMKGSLAAMVTATERFLAANPEPGYRIAWLITSDEEGEATHGTRKVVDWLQKQGMVIDWCLVGEPSSSERVGDQIKNGRRGSLGGQLLVKGTQGHVAYPQLADNPIHRLAPALAELVKHHWDRGNEHFPATSFQASNISAGTGAANVIPDQLQLEFNFRFSTEQSLESLKATTEEILKRHQLDYELNWNVSGLPFLTPEGTLVDACRQAILSETGQETELSTAGGTSDGRFIAPSGSEVVELGLVNSSIHQVNERVGAADLDVLSSIYEQLLIQLMDSL